MAPAINCPCGKGGKFIEEGNPELDGSLPVNMEGGLQASGHAIGATGIMQAVYAFWQLQGSMQKHMGNGKFQGSMQKHMGNGKFQVKNPSRGLIHSHAGTGAYEAVTIMEAV